MVQTTAALCSVLSAALERLPEAFLRSNFSSATSAVEAVVQQHPEDVSMLPSKLTVAFHVDVWCPGSDDCPGIPMTDGIRELAGGCAQTCSSKPQLCLGSSRFQRLAISSASICAAAQFHHQRAAKGPQARS